MTYKEIKGCDKCPLKIDGFCQGFEKETDPMCLSWEADTDVDKILLDLLLKDM